MTNLGQMLKQAQQLQGKMQEVQEQLAETKITGSSGGGMCQVVLNGKGEAQRVKIDPSLVGPENSGALFNGEIFIAISLSSVCQIASSSSSLIKISNTSAPL